MKIAKTSNHSNSFQSENDINITINNGLGYREVKDIFQDLLSLNFPKIQTIAENKVQERIGKFLEELNLLLIKFSASIDSSRFYELNVQYQMQNIIVDVARKGEKSNTEILSELVIQLFLKNTNETEELITTEAIKVVPLLSKKHIAFLRVITICKKIEIHRDANIDEINTFTRRYYYDLDLLNNLAISDINYIYYQGCIKGKETKESRTIRVMPLHMSIDKSHASLPNFLIKTKLYSNFRHVNDFLKYLDKKGCMDIKN